MTDQQTLAIQAEDWFPIEPSDRYNFVGDTQKNPKGYARAALWVNVGGDISLRSACGNDQIFQNVPAGFLAVSCVRVNATGTSSGVSVIGVIQKSELAVK